MSEKKQYESPYESAEQVESAFYNAFGNGDFYLMESLYADEGVSCIHPGCNTMVGRKAVIDNWKFVLENIPKTTIDIQILDKIKNKVFEVRQVLESFVIDEQYGLKSKTYTTNVYILQKNGWRLQTQHVSTPMKVADSFKNCLKDLEAANLSSRNLLH